MAERHGTRERSRLSTERTTVSHIIFTGATHFCILPGDITVTSESSCRTYRTFPCPIGAEPPHCSRYHYQIDRCYHAAPSKPRKEKPFIHRMTTMSAKAFQLRQVLNLSNRIETVEALKKLYLLMPSHSRGLSIPDEIAHMRHYPKSRTRRVCHLTPDQSGPGSLYSIEA